MLNVIAMLVSFIALVALLNGLFGVIHDQLAWFPASLQTVLGWIGRPVAWVMGVPWQDSETIGGLLGTRTVLNEFIAFSELGQLKASARSPLLRHRVVRARRVRQLQLGGDSDRRNRRPGARTRRAILRGWVSAPCWRGRWPISCRPASRACCYDGDSPSSSAGRGNAVGLVRQRLDGRQPTSPWCSALDWVFSSRRSNRHPPDSLRGHPRFSPADRSRP